MSNLAFGKETAIALLEQEDKFPVSLDDAWKWIGYKQKLGAKKTLVNNFTEGVDYRFLLREYKNSDSGFASSGEKVGRGQPAKVILLTVDCFKKLAMMADTEKGDKIRDYFLECEAIAKAATNQHFPRFKLPNLLQIIPFTDVDPVAPEPRLAHYAPFAAPRNDKEFTNVKLLSLGKRMRYYGQDNPPSWHAIEFLSIIHPEMPWDGRPSQVVSSLHACLWHLPKGSWGEWTIIRGENEQVNVVHQHAVERLLLESNYEHAAELWQIMSEIVPKKYQNLLAAAK